MESMSKYGILNRRNFLKLVGVSTLLPFANKLILDGVISNSQDQSTPNILILVLDALSARNMSLYGYHRKTTPKLEEFSRQATVYHRHYSSGNFTSPGTASLLTGVYPWTHRAFNLQGQAVDEFSLLILFGLSSSNYNTFAYTHNPFAYVVLKQFQAQIEDFVKMSELALYSANYADLWFNSDYKIATEAEQVLIQPRKAHSGSIFLSLLEKQKRKQESKAINKQIQKKYPRGVTNCDAHKNNHSLCYTLEDGIDWLAAQCIQQPAPYMGYIHFFPPHAPYNATAKFAERFGGKWKPIKKPRHFFSGDHKPKIERINRRLYDQSIAYTDSEVDRLLKILESQGILDKTYIIITSDHGELFERSIIGHITPTLFEPNIHIPLIIRKPGQNIRQDIYTPTNAVDVLPTILKFAGLPSESWVEGSVLPNNQDAVLDLNRPNYVVEAKQNPKDGELKKATFALIKGEHKLVYFRGYENYDEIFEYYNLEKDPEELEDMFSDSNPIVKDLKDELMTKVSEVNSKVKA